MIDPKSSNNKAARQQNLLDVGPPTPLEPEIRRPKNPIWTEHKAKLIERYLYYFVLITKHGAYIDGFAGPQDTTEGFGERWSAKLVLESKPRWLQKFFLFDVAANQVEQLVRLRNEQPPNMKGEPKRTIHIDQGDSNILIPELLKSKPIKDKEATFALLDQRTFECTWQTVEALAHYKPKGQHKIELFYFLPNHWLDRALAATKDTEKLRAWWGRDDWEILRGRKPDERAKVVVARIRELGYASVKDWPIKQRDEGGGATMYYMIHATDHPEAPKLMSRAYSRVLKPKEENIEQLSWKQFFEITDDDDQDV